MTATERDEALRGWLALAAGLVQTHCILWDHSPTYRARAERVRDWLRTWTTPPVRTMLRGRLARDVEEALDG